MSPDEDRRVSRRRRRVLDRVAALRRVPPLDARAAAREAPAEVDPDPGPEHAEVARLQARVDHLEAAFEGLQDSVHREALRHQHEIAELRRRLEPAAIGRALSDDARRRGL